MIISLFSGSEQRFLRVLRPGEGTRDGFRAPVSAEIVLVEDDIRSVRILEALFRLKGVSLHRTRKKLREYLHKEGYL